AELVKHARYDDNCRDRGWGFVPLAVDSYGRWGQEAHVHFAKFASRLAVRTKVSQLLSIGRSGLCLHARMPDLFYRVSVLRCKSVHVKCIALRPILQEISHDLFLCWPPLGGLFFISPDTVKGHGRFCPSRG